MLVNYANRTEYLCASISHEGVLDPEELAALIQARRLSDFSLLTGRSIRTTQESVLPRRPESADAIQHRLYKETSFDSCRTLFLSWGSTAIVRQAMSRIVKGRGEIVEMRGKLVTPFDCIDLCSLYRACSRSLDVDMKFRLSAIWKMVFGSDPAAETGKSRTARWDAAPAVQLTHHLAGNVPARQKKEYGWLERVCVVLRSALPYDMSG